MEKVTSEIRQGISFLHQYLGEDATLAKVVDPKDSMNFLYLRTT
jgi:hypothetical protein